jgi:site-specific DNA recombinase
MRFIKDPRTGKRVSRINATDQRMTIEVPELRIIDQHVWDQVQARLGGIRDASSANRPDRPKFW